MTLWLKADDLVGIDGDAVSSWISAEGNAYNFAQTSTKCPLLKKGVNGIGGKNTVLFDGTNDLLVLPSAPLTGSVGTVVILYRFSLLSLMNQHLLSMSDQATVLHEARFLGYGSGTSPYTSLHMKEGGEDDIVAGNQIVTKAVPILGVWQSDGTKYVSYTQGMKQAMTASTGTNDGLWFGGLTGLDNTVIGALKATGESSFFGGDVAEIIVYDRFLSNGELAGLHRYIASKYSLPLTFQGDPYNLLSYGADPAGIYESVPALQNMVNRAHADGGATLYAPSGTYKLSNYVDWYSNIDLYGAGISATKFKFYASSALRFLGAIDAPISDCDFHDFEMDGINQVDGTNNKGFYMRYMLRVNWWNLYIHDTAGSGIGCGFLVNCTITDVELSGCGHGAAPTDLGRSGLGIGTGQYVTEDLIITRANCHGNGRANILFEAQGNPDGITWFYSTGMKVIDSIANGGTWGIADNGCDGLVITNTQMNSNTQAGLSTDNPSLVSPGGSLQGKNGVVTDGEIAFNGDGGVSPAVPTGYTFTNVNIHDNTP
ncbi:MAG: glycosyl hydrolase family 28-related protein [Chloroflexota bacterium]